MSKMSGLKNGLVSVLVFAVFVLPGVVRAQPATGPGQIKRQEAKERIADKARKAFSRAMIGNGKLVSVSGAALIVEKDGKTYTVNTGTFSKCTTRFVRRFGGAATIAEFKAGDTVGVAGRWADEDKSVIEACVFRNLSVQKKFAVFVGEVKSVSSSGFVMSTVASRRPDQTVTVSGSARLVNRKEQAISLGDIRVGHRVRVKGLWNNTGNTVTEVTQVKDYTLSERTVLEASPAGTAAE